MDNPKVFISYSHDSKEHSEWVRKLATELRHSGVDAFLDVWDIRPGDNFVQKITSAIEEADHCIIVCTPRYREVAEERRSGGVGYEGSLIQNAFREKSITKPWLLPIVRAGEGREALPDWLINRMYIDWRNDERYQEHFKQLLDSLYSSSRRKPEKQPSFPGVKSEELKDKRKIQIEFKHKDLGNNDIEELRNILENYLGSDISITGGDRDE